MIFNSFSFYLFFGILFFVYYFLFKENKRRQNLLLFISSYFFYGFADWKIIPILLIATIFVFFLGKAINNSNNKQKSSLLTTFGVLAGVSLLFYFKYFNFFIESFSNLFNFIGLKSNLGTFNIIMPLGISFFTFKLISYVIEINRGKIKYCGNFVEFATYISFFPTILSGPIDKPNTFIPQLQKKRSFDYNLMIDGSRQILWGLFQKIIIADNLALLINPVWEDISSQSGSVLFVIAILYSIQLYTDFSGYSHIAIGIGKTLGFNITKNFNYPYFSRNIGEFWRNWHMSLTSWLTDYVFMPLNIRFRNLGKLGISLAIIINMLVVGLWHGPNWTYVLFGLINGLFYVPLILSGSFFKKKKLKTNKYGFIGFSDLLKILKTFLLITFAFIVFRAEDLSHAKKFLSGIFDSTFFTYPTISNIGVPLFFSILFFIFEWFSRHKEFPLSNFELRLNRPLRWIIYIAIIIAIFCFESSQKQQYIYFQF
jgi:alginate O-acetyltransferase complex protein AlgI|tara:strand:- start:1170 stop:2618 length:1449 start_codon:yes stop_codon:yes gene_type:complete